MKKLLLLLSTILVVTFCWGQIKTQNFYSFSLNGNNITPKADFHSSLKSLKTEYVKNEGQNAVILQFNSIPSIEQQQKLKAKGVVLLDYLQANAYYALVTKDIFEIKSRNSKNIRSLLPILPHYKIAKKIAKNSIPEYAKVNKKRIKIIIRYFNYADKKQIFIDLNTVQVSSIKWVNEFQIIQAEIALSDVVTLATFSWVKNICLIDPPNELNNKEASLTHRANILNSTIRGLGYGLTGKGVKVGLWDSDVFPHVDFNKRIINREYEDYDSHGTHTCGTIAGAGILDPEAKGMAPEATVYAWNFNKQSNGLTNAQERLISLQEDGIEITSNSFGYIGYGCPNEFSYDNNDVNEDKICNQYPYFLFVYSAGNDQNKCPDGYFTTTKNMKNSLVVANINNEEKVRSSSSFGPSFDGRIVPNISAVGSDVYSTVFDDTYSCKSGTSMATPGVAGVMVLLYERYKQTHGGLKPLSSLFRGLACNTATDLGNPGPDYIFGYGAINGRRAIDVMEENNYFIDSVKHGTTIRHSINVPKDVVELRVMLSWTDPEGNSATEKVLVNDLDLKVTNRWVEALPWVLDSNNPALNAVRGIDRLNNLEQVVIKHPDEGEYFIEVTGSTIPKGIQDFAVIYDIVQPILKLTYPIGGEAIAPSKQIIRWDCEGYFQPLTLEFSKNDGLSYEIIASNISPDLHHYTYTIPPDLVIANGKFRISSGSVFDENKNSFSIKAVPQNLKTTQAQCGGNGNFTLTWDTVHNASYEILKLKGQEYEFFASSSENHFEISNITPERDQYFSIRAIDNTTEAHSERSVAVKLSIPIPLVDLPFFETFEYNKAPNFLLNSVEGYGVSSLSMLGTEQGYAIKLEGALNTDDWVDASGEDCFLNNPNYIVKANICNLNATDFVDKKMTLSFDFLQNYLETPGTSYFRLKVNDEYLTDHLGRKIFGDSVVGNIETLYYDLSNHTCMSSISIVFEAVCKSNSNMNNSYFNNSGEGDFILIDNVRIDELDLDYQLKWLSYGTDHTTTEPITVCIQNMSGEDGINIPVSYQINSETEVVETITDTIPSLTEYVYTFSQKADLSAEKTYELLANVHAPYDTITENNSQSLFFGLDNTSVKMGGEWDTISTCNARFTDEGGIFENYKANKTNTLTFKPQLANKVIVVNFDELNIEENFDFLYVYNGASNSSPLLEAITGTQLPLSFTSTAPGGELTFEFVSDYMIVESGWVAHVHCKDRIPIDLSLNKIVKPSLLEGIFANEEKISFEVENRGAQSITKFIAYYQIDSLAPEVEEFTTNLSLGAKEVRSFSAQANFTTPGNYVLNVWIETAGDTVANNNMKTVDISSIASLPDIGVSELSAIPCREKNSTVSISIVNYGSIPLSNFDIAYRINNREEVLQTFTDTIGAGETQLIEFKTKVNLTERDATYYIEAYTKLPDDKNTENDMQQMEITTHSSSETNVFANFTNGTNTLRAGTASKIDLVNDYTVECWVKVSEEKKSGTFLNKGNITLSYTIDVLKEYYGNRTILLQVKTNEGNFIVYVPEALKPGKWQYIALTVSSDNNYILYVDGEALQWKTFLGTMGAGISNAEYPLCIGNHHEYNTLSAIGKIDEFRVWNKCLDETTIRENSMTNYAPNTPGLLAYYKFSEGTGKYVYDYSLNDNTAIIENADLSELGGKYFWNTPGEFLTNFSIEGQKTPTTFDAETRTFNVNMDDIDSSSLIASYDNYQHSIVTVDDSVQQSGVTANNFASGSLLYVAEGIGFNQGIKQSYNILVNVDKNSKCKLETFSFEKANNPSLESSIVLIKNGDCFEQKVNRNLDISQFKASFTISPGAIMFIDNVEQASPQSLALDYSKPLLLTVVSENQRYFKNYKILVDTNNSEAELMSFSIIDEQVGASLINTTNNTVNIWTKNNTNLNALTSVFDVSDNAGMYVKSVTQRNGITVNNFVSPVTYTIVSEDETNWSDWIVQVSIDTIKPELTLLGDSVVTINKGDAFTDPGATAFDNVNGDISLSIEVLGIVDTEEIGSYLITYKASDEAGNTSTITRNVIVEKTTGINNRNLIEVGIFAINKTIYINVPAAMEGADVSIYNINGSKVYQSSKINSGMNTIQTKLLQGLYLVRLVKKEQFYSGKVIIN